MEEIINGLKQIKTRVDSGTITTVNGTETLLSKQLASMLEKAINYTRCSTQLFGVSKIEIDCVTINKEYKIIFENDETYVFINDFGQADEMYKKHFKDVKTK
jgi:hypothetical protein